MRTPASSFHPAHKSTPRAIAASLMVWLTLSIHALTPALATTPGEIPQGTAVQGTILPGGDHRWLQGATFIARLADHTLVEITHFAGDTIHAIEHHGTARYREPVTLHPLDLVGMQWTESQCDPDGCIELDFRIADVAPDRSQNTMPGHSDNSDIWLYRVEHQSAGQPWTSVCELPADRAAGNLADTDMGLFVDGRWAADGGFDADGYMFSCPRGSIAKCARAWGYKPWLTLPAPDRGPQDRIDLQPVHLACTRAARAEYCGDGISYTRDGTGIYMGDSHGFNRPLPPWPFVLESGFDEHGAVFLDHPRYPDLVPTCQPGRSTQPGQDALVQVWSVQSTGH